MLLSIVLVLLILNTTLALRHNDISPEMKHEQIKVLVFVFFNSTVIPTVLATQGKLYI